MFGLDVPGECIDAKSFNMSPRNKYFAINNNKHLQLTRVRPDYFCMISLPLGNGVQFCIVPHADVDGWEVKELIRGKAPARITDIKAFTESRLGTEYSVLTSRLSQCFAREQVKHDALENAEVLARLQQDSPNLCRAVPILTSELRASVTALLAK